MNFGRSYTKLILFLTIATFLLIFISCKNENDKIPDVYVNFEINLNDPNFIALQSIGNYVYTTGGVNGIILYRKSSDEINAFERTCPYDPDCGKVFVTKTLMSAKDTICCNSEFSLFLDGAVLSGASNFPLKYYSTVFDSYSNVVKVTN